MTGDKQILTETHIVVTGTVQGVFFRAKTKEHADRLGLKGYVQNLPNGNVEICVAGEGSDTLVACLKKEPLPVMINKIEITKQPLATNYSNFEIISA